MKHKILYTLCSLIAIISMAGCAGINSILKSGKPDLIFDTAMQYYNKQKWSKASTLLEGVQHYYTGTTREDSILYFNAHCKFKSHDYEQAATQLDDFRRKFGRSGFIENAEGMYAMCFYNLSPGPKRDQTMTTQALIAINEFMSRYPNSTQIENFKNIEAELIGRLHEKAFINASTYYKIGKYKSAIMAFKNALKQYPDTKYREELMYLIVDAGYKFASNSVLSKQTDRYLAMLDSYLSFKEQFPESPRMKEASRMAKIAQDYLDRNNKEKSI